ncbi:DUF4287 domain-containing protein [Streptomyces sp. A3M-1-3]|uniref:DUF4287 domain-containing protein n=1 Tax=Streptomyces sp. A3M-1-3 TaxID=2962044 RepID=UPI0020B71610|nr:DUF4287 domain-containing protein [Streptomyces sp. A3M-1-3]MCP3820611.1 DUF4287 domain-containing protein [Streptomyces sp. A3M-1-3]
MTRQKSFKTRVRTRMDKTGESYTTARRQLLDKAGTEPEQTAAAAAGVRALQLPEAAVRERTGRGGEEWFALLDAWGGTGHTHTEIARRLVEEHGVDGWWAQSITVAYEQARGMRAPGQKSDGYFSAGASKTVAVPVDRLFEAFADTSLRERWLPGARIKVRTASAPKSFRADWEDGSTRLVVGFTAKDEAKAVVGVAHERLTDADAAARMKAYWRERLAALKELLEA